MNDQRDILIQKMRKWIGKVLRSTAKGYALPSDLFDEGFDLYEGIGNPILIYGPAGKERFISQKDYDEMKDLYENQSKKIAAIKILKSITDWGLKDSKLAVEDSRNFDQGKDPEPNYGPY